MAQRRTRSFKFGWMIASKIKCCNVEISGEIIDETMEPTLPTRIIDVGPSDGSQEPRLVVTDGNRGRYIALSHCWGTQEQLKTEIATLKERLHHIPWDTIPKTF